MNLRSPVPSRQQLLETLTLAFMEDPLYRWLYPDEPTRPQALLDDFQLMLSLARDRGHVDTTPSGEGIALWTDPGVELLDDPAPFLQLLRRWAPERVEPALAGMAACSLYEVAVPGGGPTMRPMRRLAGRRAAPIERRKPAGRRRSWLLGQPEA